MATKYRKKPVVVEAIQWNGNTNYNEIEQFVGASIKTEVDSDTAYVAGAGQPTFVLLIETKEGVMKAFKNDFIIKEPFPTGDRDFYPCKPEIFRETYDVASERAAHEPFYELSQDFRAWQKEWDAYDNGTGPKPQSVDGFLETLKAKFEISRR